MSSRQAAGGTPTLPEASALDADEGGSHWLSLRPPNVVSSFFILHLKKYDSRKQDEANTFFVEPCIGNPRSRRYRIGYFVRSGVEKIRKASRQENMVLSLGVFLQKVFRKCPRAGCLDSVRQCLSWCREDKVCHTCLSRCGWLICRIATFQICIHTVYHTPKAEIGTTETPSSRV